MWLTHWGWVMHLYISKLTINWFRCWNIVNWNLGNKFQWNDNQNSYIFIQENAFENVVCKMVAILSQPQYVDCTLLFFALCGYLLPLLWVLKRILILLHLSLYGWKGMVYIPWLSIRDLNSFSNLNGSNMFCMLSIFPFEVLNVSLWNSLKWKSMYM